MNKAFAAKFFLGICGLSLYACTDEKSSKESLFTQLPASVTSVDFANTLIEDESFNIIEYLYFYNGGGVAIGDINNDSLPDIYFSSNQGPNKLYLNKGNFKFEDVTKKAGVEGAGNWKTGVTMADVNDDGYLDIYLCGVGKYKRFDGRNQLFINNGDLTFTEKSKEFGLDFQGLSTHASFFDYDLDGDLDMYLLNHSVHSTRSYGKMSLRYQVDSLAGDRLYKNLYVETGTVYYKDVSKQAGIFSSQIGYGLSIGVADFNRDGYPDMYVSNDFHENDYLYINRKDGTFAMETQASLPHTSRFSMGNETADINNDLWPDVMTLDMLPREESVIKTSAGEDSYEVYKYKLSLGYGKQVSRNALQLNRGVIDSGRLVFSDVAQVAGVEATDWSWCPLAVDFDGDGHKDLFISNGIVRRPNDLDYINFISTDSVQKKSITSPLSLAKEMPEGKVSNFIYRNRGDVTFEDVTTQWGLWTPSFSNGAAYGDLDNDGDPDLVVNRINEEALIYKNNSSPDNFIKVKLSAQSLKGNQRGVGAKVIVEDGNGSQMQELFPSRGWCSSSDYALTFGVKDRSKATVKVVWPDGRVTTSKITSRSVTLEYQPSAGTYDYTSTHSYVFEAVKVAEARHIEDDFNAFNRESLIPHMLTTQGPPLAVADCNGDGRDDFFMGGGKNQSGFLYMQKPDGTFERLKSDALDLHKANEDTDACFADVDGDGDQDLIVVSGGQEEMENEELLMPRLYLNDGKGKFNYNKSSFPDIFLHASCVKPCDYDSDGDMDLFMGAVVMPFLYGMSPMSFLLQNDGKGHFQIVHDWLGQSVFDNPTRVRPGMVKDATWIDLNGDGLKDMVLVGEWMPITVLIQDASHHFSNQTTAFGLDATRGWWNTCEKADIDHDGDEDMIIGNLGLNSRIKASPQKPLQMYLGDFDSNGGSDHIMVYYNGEQSYPFASRDQLVRQIPSLKKKFLRYKDYRDVKLEDIITPVQKGNSALMKVEQLQSVLLKNNAGKLEVIELPLEAQYFPVFGILPTDFNQDGHMDLLLTGNLSATQPDFGSYDSGVGLALTGDGKGNFKPMPPLQSGFVVRGEGRSIVALQQAQAKGMIYLISRNNETLVSFRNYKP